MLNTDRVVKKRQIYNFLDLMGDIGGLKEALSQLCAFVLFIYGNDFSLDSFLVNKIFRKSSEQEKEFPKGASDI